MTVMESPQRSRRLLTRYQYAKATKVLRLKSTRDTSLDLSRSYLWLLHRAFNNVTSTRYNSILGGPLLCGRDSFAYACKARLPCYQPLLQCLPLIALECAR